MRASARTPPNGSLRPREAGLQRPTCDPRFAACDPARAYLEIPSLGRKGPRRPLPFHATLANERPGTPGTKGLDPLVVPSLADLIVGFVLREEGGRLRSESLVIRIHLRDPLAVAFELGL